jgi:hypothetical protein
MMNAMMQAMIRNMTPEEREAMMLEMMPEMMKKADLNTLLGNMTAKMGKIITLYGVYSLIRNLLSDPDLKAEIAAGLEQLHENMAEMMPMMVPVMQEIMPAVMAGMLPLMAGVMREMAAKQECLVADAVKDDPKLKTMMGEMFFNMAPHMAKAVIPNDKGQMFIDKVEVAVGTKPATLKTD